MDIEVRPVADHEITQVVDLVADRIGDDDAREAELVLNEPDFDRSRWLVAVEGSDVLSTAAVFPGSLRVGDVEGPAGAIEFVATRERAEGKGLVRRIMEEIHRTAPDRGELAQWIVGITYFYRRLGYEYAIPVDGMHLLDARDARTMPDGWSVRSADRGEGAKVADAQRDTGLTADVALAAAPWMWEIYVRSPSYDVIVAEGTGEIGAEGTGEIGYGRLYSWEDDHYLTDVAAGSVAAARALASAASDGGQRDVTVMSRPAVRRYFDPVAPHVPGDDAYYVRVGDPVALLERMRPVLSKRLVAAGLMGQEGEALLSLYASSIKFSYLHGEVGPMRREGRVPGPIGAGGSGVAPDLIASLLLGPQGAARLAEVHPDVNLGDQAELMEALFPPQTCDVHSWVIP